MTIFFITGASGSGKTTVMDHLKEQLPVPHFIVHDFDEVGANSLFKITYTLGTFFRRRS